MKCVQVDSLLDLPAGLIGEVRADGMRPVSDEHGRVMGAVAPERVDHDRGVRAESGLDQVVVDGADGEQCGDGRAVGIGAGGLLSVGQDDAL